MNSKAELEQGYLETVYSVFVDGEKYNIKIGPFDADDSSALLTKTKNRSGVIITAWNPRSRAAASVENKKRNAELSDYLMKNHYTFYAALGQGQDGSWAAEESFFIVDINNETAESLAVAFGQNAYVRVAENKPASLIFSAVWND